MRKYLFVVFYTIIQWVEVPCPSNNIGCMVYHGTRLDTTTYELMTTDSSKVNALLKNHKTTKVDTFLLTPLNDKP